MSALVTPKPSTVLRSTVAGAPEAAATLPVPVPAAVRWSLCAFLFSLLFESLGDAFPVETTQVTGALLLLAAIVQPRFMLRKPPFAFWGFSLYFYVCLGHAAFSGQPGEILSRLAILAQMLALCWVAYCAFCEERTARQALLTFVGSATLLGIASLLGVTVTTAEAQSRQHRLASFGLDPNQLAACAGFALLALTALVYDGKRVAVRLRWVAPVLAGLIGMVVVQTGSRGGLVALCAGLLTFAWRGRTPALKMRNLSLVLALFVFIGAAVSQSDVFRRRIESEVETGDMALREKSYPISWALVQERPWAGWGPFQNSVEIGRRLNHPAYPRMDTHNLALYVLTATGLLGAVPFLLATASGGVTAWRARSGPHGGLPFALFASLMVADLTVTGMHWKQHWVVIAYALAAVHHLAPVAAGSARFRRGWRRGQSVGEATA
jgi:O-antigen ligase